MKKKLSSPRRPPQTPPALKAALAFLIPVIGLRFVSSVFAPSEWWLFVFGVIYLVNGYTAGRLYSESVYHARVRQGAENARQQGAGAGILLFLLGWIGYAILIVLTNIFTSFTPSLPIGILFICGGFIEFLVALGFGAFGASRYK